MGYRICLLFAAALMYCINADASSSRTSCYCELDGCYWPFEVEWGKADDRTAPAYITGWGWGPNDAVQAINVPGVVYSSVNALTPHTVVGMEGQFSNSFVKQLTVPDSMVYFGEKNKSSFSMPSKWNLQRLETLVLGRSFRSFMENVDNFDRYYSPNEENGYPEVCDGRFHGSQQECVGYAGSVRFGLCTNLTSFSVSSANVALRSNGGILYSAGYEYYSDGSPIAGTEGSDVTLLLCPPGKRGSVRILESTVRIGRHSFSGCVGLTNVVIPDSVKHIENYAFQGCSNLTSVTIGGGVTAIKKGAFSNCRKLSSVTLPSTAQNIWSYAFEDCVQLTKIDIPNGATINSGAFSGCTALTEVVLRGPPQSMPDNCFSDSSSCVIYVPRGSTGWGVDIPGTYKGCRIEYLGEVSDDITDDPDLKVTTGGNGAWSLADITHNGMAAMRSGDISDKEESWLEVAVDGPGTLSFWWRASTEHYGDDIFDYAFLSVDGRPLGKLNDYRLSGIAIGGTVDWQYKEVDVDIGRHDVRWTYRKDEVDESGVGDDCVWLSQLSFRRKSVAEFDINGGSGDAPDAMAVYPGTTISLPSDTGFLREDYAFAGWSDGISTYAVGSKYVMPETNVVFRAQWNAGRNLVFSLDGAEGEAPALIKAFPGNTVVLPLATGFGKPLHTFVGWNDGSRLYDAGSSYTVSDADVSFVAVWSANTLTAPVITSGDVVNGEISEKASATIVISAQAGASIYYTLDGTEPTSESILYNGPFVADGLDTTIRAITIRENHYDSPVSVFSFSRYPYGTDECLNVSGASIASEGNKPWGRVLGTAAHDGTAALKSGAIGDGETSSVEMTVAGSGTIGFWWKVSSEISRNRKFDYVSFLIDDVEVSWHGGEMDWTNETFAVEGEGLHTFKWIYQKNTNNMTQGEDCAWLDEVSWTPPPVFSSVFYENLRGGTHTNPETYQEGTSVSFTDPSGVTGYTFAGWTPSQITADMTGVQTIRANWTANSYTISYNANGGSGTTSATVATYDSEVQIAQNGFTRTRYIFDGWATEANGDVVYVPGETVRNLTAVNGGVVTLYAVWSMAPIPELDDNATESEVVSALSGVRDSALAANIKNGSGYRAFRNWAVGKGLNLQNVKDSPNAWLSYALDADKLIEGEIADGDLRVESFMPGGEDGIFDMKVRVADASLGPAAALENLVRAFVVEGTPSLTDAFSVEKVAVEFGEPDNGAATFSILPREIGNAFFVRTRLRNHANSDKGNGCEVSFNLNGGGSLPEGMSAKKFVEYASAYGELPTPTREGYAFDGWYTMASGGEKVTSASQMLIIVSQTLYARWTIKSYTVVFNANGGSGDVSKSYNHGALFGELPVPVRDGYVFVGWFTAVSGGTQVTASAVVTGPQTLYARWKTREKVQLWEGGPYWATTNIGAEKPEDYGYYFWWGDTVGYKRENDKWVASNGSNSNFSFTESNTPTYGKDNSTLQSEDWITADGVLSPEYDAAKKHWGSDWRMPTKQEIDDLNSKCNWTWTTVNGVNGYIVCGRGDYASNSIFLPCAGRALGTALDYVGSDGRYWSSVLYSNSKNAYDFSFYLDGHSAGNIYRTRGQSIRPVQGLPCVTFDTCGGSSVDSIFIPFGQALGELPIPTREGYVFDGWWTASSGGTQVTTSTVVTGSQILYARWTIKIYSVVFDANGGSGGVSKSYNHGATLGELPVPTREGYEFIGWFTAASGGTQVTANTTIFVEKTTLYAQWRKTREKVQLWEGGPYWATTNIGAEKPEDYGYYFWWGDTVGYKRENGKWVASDGSNSNFSFTESNTPTYVKDNSTLQSEGWITADDVLAHEHDAAQKHWGGDWRMPTIQEFDDLGNKCDWTWTTVNGVNGYIVRGRGDYSSSSIFLPCAGYGDGTSLKVAGYFGFYWSSVPHSDYYYAWDFLFRNSGGPDGTHDYYRYSGLSVRPLQGAGAICVTVTFDACGGSSVDSISIPLGQAIGELPVPTRNGYTFVGWFTAASSGTQVTANTTVSASMTTLYAQWENVLSVSLSGALDIENMEVTGGGNVGWFGQKDVSHDAVDAAQSGDISDSQTSWMQVVVKDISLVSFWWKVSSESNYDKLHFYVDGTEVVDPISGQRDWIKVEYKLAPGSHTLKWSYTKDGSVTSGDDCGWVDSVVLSQSQPQTREKVQLWDGGPYWATTNIGAEKPEDYGYYFWWGDTVGYKRENNKWVASDGSNSNFSFIESNTPTYGKDNSTLQSEGWITSDGVLVPEHDVAQAYWGGDWRMPTKQEFDELDNKCDWTWTTMNGVKGYVVRGRGDYASNSIFLPCAGFGYWTSLDNAGLGGRYWSSVPNSDDDGHAWGLYFNSSSHGTFDDYRRMGLSVRLVQGVSCVAVTFDACGGSSVDSISIPLGQAIGELPVPTRNGYTFVGWFTAASSGTQVTANTTAFVSMTTLYAQWQKTHEKVQLWENGPYWATTNIGAEKPEDYGYYFWWGDTVGYKRENNKWVASDGSNSNFSFSLSNAPTRDKSNSTLQSEGWITADGVLAPEHDAAQAHWGGDWRMPTKQEFDDLKNKCDWTWAPMNGVNGYVVRGRGDYSSASIFLPCAGLVCSSSLSFAGSYGGFWSSVPNSGTISNAWSLGINSSGYHDTFNYESRSSGQSVRPLQGFTK